MSGICGIRLRVPKDGATLQGIIKTFDYFEAKEISGHHHLHYPAHLTNLKYLQALIAA